MDTGRGFRKQRKRKENKVIGQKKIQGNLEKKKKGQETRGKGQKEKVKDKRAGENGQGSNRDRTGVRG